MFLRESADPKGRPALMDSQDLLDPREPGEKLDNLDLLDNQETEESQVSYNRENLQIVGAETPS